jgi:flagellar protein FlbD
MIVLHKLTHAREPLHLNPDLLQVIEARPDTHITLTTGTHLVVSESPEEIAEAVRAYRIDVLAAALAVQGTAPAPAEAPAPQTPPARPAPTDLI